LHQSRGAESLRHNSTNVHITITGQKLSGPKGSTMKAGTSAKPRALGQRRERMERLVEFHKMECMHRLRTRRKTNRDRQQVQLSITSSEREDRAQQLPKSRTTGSGKKAWRMDRTIKRTPVRNLIDQFAKPWPTGGGNHRQKNYDRGGEKESCTQMGGRSKFKHWKKNDQKKKRQQRLDRKSDRRTRKEPRPAKRKVVDQRGRRW